MKNESKAVASTSVSILTMQIARYFLQFIYLIVMSRFLDPRDFGIVAIVLSIVGVAVIFSDFGMSLASIRERDLPQRKKTTLFYLNSLMGILLTSIVAISAYPISQLMHEPVLYPVTLAISNIFWIMGLGVQHRAEYSIQRRLSAFSKLEFVSFLISVIIGIISATFEFGLWALVFQQLMFPLIKTVLTVAHSKWKPSSIKIFKFSEIRDMIRFGNSATLTSLLYYVTTNLDTALVGGFHGGRVVGLYNRAFQLTNLPIIQFTAPLTRLFVPMLSESSKASDFKGTVKRVQRYLGYMLLLPLSAILALYQSWVPILFGEVWEESTRFIWILGLAAGVQSIGYIYYWIFISLGKPQLLLKAELPGRLAMVVLMSIFVSFDSLGVAWSIVVGQIMMWCLTALRQGPRIGFSALDLLKELRAPATVSLLSLLSCFIVDLCLTNFDFSPLDRALWVLITWLISVALQWKLFSVDIRSMARSLRAKPSA